MAERESGLTEQQYRFCHEYAADPSNATRAYRRAYRGSSHATAKVEASKLLARPDVQEELRAARTEYLRHCRVDFARILREIAAIAFADPDDIWEEGPDGTPRLRKWSDIPPAARRTILSIKVKRKRLWGGGGKDDCTEWEVEDIDVKQHGKDAALDKLCRHLGITKDGDGIERLLKLVEGQAGPGTPPGVHGGDPDPAG